MAQSWRLTLVSEDGVAAAAVVVNGEVAADEEVVDAVVVIETEEDVAVNPVAAASDVVADSSDMFVEVDLRSLGDAQVDTHAVMAAAVEFGYTGAVERLKLLDKHHTDEARAFDRQAEVAATAARKGWLWTAHFEALVEVVAESAALVAVVPALAAEIGAEQEVEELPA